MNARSGNVRHEAQIVQDPQMASSRILAKAKRTKRPRQKVASEFCRFGQVIVDVDFLYFESSDLDEWSDLSEAEVHEATPSGWGPSGFKFSLALWSLSIEARPGRWTANDR